jgi:acetyl-CoA carboxylase biotin carboxyl carrier protein
MTDDLEPTLTPATGDLAAEAVVEPLAETPPEAPPPSDGGDVELLRLIDRLASLLDRSDLTELEVESGGTGLVLRKPSALAPITVASVAAASPAATTMTAPSPGESSTAGREPAPAAKPSIKAPLTGIFYASPAPGSAPYVAVGGEVAVGQVIGLIEAMKLFNEIKSDVSGRISRVLVENGTLVKRKQPLLEIDPR